VSAPAHPDLVLINGQPAGGDGGGVSILDRGLHYGDGLFETIACRGGRARFLSLHLERLVSGCQRLQIQVGDPAVIRREIEQAIAGTEAALLKIIVTRGEARARGYGLSGNESPNRILLRYGWPAESPAAQTLGVTVRLARLRLGENPALAGIKHLNRLEQVLARAEAPPDEATELLLLNTSGHLVCGTMSNVFLVQGGRIKTPRLDSCGVAGVMRRVVLLTAKNAGLIAEEGEVRPAELEGAEEVFLTNARVGIWPVYKIGDRALIPGAITRRLQTLIAPMLENPVDA
jgi:4-amino-4-deoxychorismate lyase